MDTHAYIKATLIYDRMDELNFNTVSRLNLDQTRLVRSNAIC